MERYDVSVQRGLMRLCAPLTTEGEPSPASCVPHRDFIGLRYPGEWLRYDIS